MVAGRDSLVRGGDGEEMERENGKVVVSRLAIPVNSSEKEIKLRQKLIPSKKSFIWVRGKLSNRQNVSWKTDFY